MDTIQLSIEELIFCFYSEGQYEQGILMKETYFPALQDSELKLMLEFAARSLLAKNMVTEVDTQYKLKDEYRNFIKALVNAEKTVKASKFDSEHVGEESISFHFRNGTVYFHRLLHDHQVHLISKVAEKEVISTINCFFHFNAIDKQSDILYKLKNEEFEELLKDVSQSDSLSQLNLEKWNARVQESFPMNFLEDVSARKGKMDSILSLKYNSENNPELIDLYFVVPGKSESWLITREKSLDLNIQRVNETSINTLILNNDVFSI